MNPEFMQRAIELAARNIREGGGPFAAVIVKDGRIVAETGNTVTRSNDPTAHAEVNAIREACRRLQTFELRGCEIYSSCEPCPMCMAAIYWARLDTLYFAATRTDAAQAGFDDAFLYEELPLEYRKRSLPCFNVMAEEGKLPFADWARYDEKVPY
ncbi:MAG: nucleoside deaminase [Bacteroidales bacterium]|nr:nucleoside deaminase [Bacteroidales bacterium]